MLKVYVCPKCKAVRYVSKFKTECFKCNINMSLSSISYEEYIRLEEQERLLYLSKTFTA